MTAALKYHFHFYQYNFLFPTETLLLRILKKLSIFEEKVNKLKRNKRNSFQK